jgi:hypothetical protein
MMSGEFIVEAQQYVGRLREIYNEAIAHLLAEALPVQVYVGLNEVRKIPARIIRNNLDKLTTDIVLHIYEASPSDVCPDYYVKLFLCKDGVLEPLSERELVKCHELPNILEKSYRITYPDRPAETPQINLQKRSKK